MQVFPDGELDIQALADASNSPAYVNPTGAVRTMHARGQSGASRAVSAAGGLTSMNGRPPTGAIIHVLS
jgi:hypothetical protein